MQRFPKFCELLYHVTKPKKVSGSPDCTARSEHGMGAHRSVTCLVFEMKTFP